MFVEVWCDRCNRKLRVQREALGKQVHCPVCSAVFVAQDVPVVEPVAPTPPSRPSAPPPLPRPVPAPPLLLPATGPSGVRPAPVPVSPVGPPADFPPVEFNVSVKSDPQKVLKGVFNATVTAEGLRLRQGRQHNLLLPVGTPAQYLESTHFLLEIEGREVSLTVAKLWSYQARIARDVVAFLRGRKRVLHRADYKLEWYLFLPALLPLGIPILTQGGAVWGGLGAGLAGACLGIAQIDKLPKGARLAIALGIGVAGYLLIFLFFGAALAAAWGRRG
jgi:hypothetical protein